jgi:hypothetical protein
MVFSDKCTIYKSNKCGNVHFWSKQNSHSFQGWENNPPHVMIWDVTSAKHLFGPHFFEVLVNQGTYLIMLWNWFVSVGVF